MREFISITIVLICASMSLLVIVYSYLESLFNHFMEENMKIITVFIVACIIYLCVRIAILEDNQYKFNEAVQNIAGGLVELRGDIHVR